MRKRSKRILSSLLGLLCACLIGGGANLIKDSPLTPVTAVAEGIANEQDATTINYDGTPTGRYAVEKYAGRSGAAWIKDEQVIWTDFGKDGHVIGSNSSDNRSNLELVFQINCSNPGSAYLWLYVSGDLSQAATFKVVAGDGTELWKDEALIMNGQRVRIDKDHSQHQDQDPDPMETAHFPVVLYMNGLHAGLNYVYLTMGENYDAWFYSFAVSPTGARTSEYEVDTMDIIGTSEGEE